MNNVETISALSKILNIPYSHLFTSHFFREPTRETKHNRPYNYSNLYHSNVGYHTYQTMNACLKLKVDALLNSAENIFYSMTPTNVDTHNSVIGMEIPDNIDQKHFTRIKEIMNEFGLVAVKTPSRYYVKPKLDTFVTTEETRLRNAMRHFKNNALCYDRYTPLNSHARKGCAFYGITFADADLMDIVSKFRDNKVEHYIVNVLFPIKCEDGKNRYIPNIIGNELVGLDDIVDSLKPLCKHITHRSNMTLDSHLDTEEHIACGTSITKASIKLHNELSDEHDPTEVFYKIINNIEDFPLLVKFKFNASDESASYRTLELVKHLYEDGNGYLTRNSWANSHREKILRGGSLLVPYSVAVKTIKMLMIYGCMKDDIEICFNHSFLKHYMDT